MPDDKEGYLSGWVMSEDRKYGGVMVASGNEVSPLDLFLREERMSSLTEHLCITQTHRVPLNDFSKMTPPKFDRVDDIADLTFFAERASYITN